MSSGINPFCSSEFHISPFSLSNPYLPNRLKEKQGIYSNWSSSTPIPDPLFCWNPALLENKTYMLTAWSLEAHHLSCWCFEKFKQRMHRLNRFLFPSQSLLYHPYLRLLGSMISLEKRRVNSLWHNGIVEVIWNGSFVLTLWLEWVNVGEQETATPHQPSEH